MPTPEVQREMTSLPATTGHIPEGPALVAPAERPLVSVVLPCYREPLAVLRRALDSVLRQTYPNLEFILVVDDPDDEAKIAALKDLAETDNRIRVVLNPVNIGPWGSYNRGVREARGAIIAIQDSDDVSAPTRIEILTEFCYGTRISGWSGRHSTAAMPTVSCRLIRPDWSKTDRKAANGFLDRLVAFVTIALRLCPAANVARMCVVATAVCQTRTRPRAAHRHNSRLDWRHS